MECAEIGKAANDWQLRKDAAERALHLAVGNSQQSGSVELAARHLAAATLGKTTELDELPQYLEELRGILKRLVDDAKVKGQKEQLKELAETVSGIAMLLTEPGPAAQVRLCSRLRKVDRPDLGIKAAERGLKVEPKNTALLTTLAAAQLDVGASTKGLATIEGVVEQGRPNYRALLVYSRALQAVSRPERSLRVARDAFELDANEFTAHRILAAAAELRDLETFEGALQFVRRHQSEVSAEADLYVLLLAVQALLETDELVKASELFQEVEVQKLGKKLQGRPVQLYNLLKRRLKNVLQPTLPMSDDSASN